MKANLFVLALLFTAHATLGQNFDKDKITYTTKVKNYKRIKITGIILTAVSAGVTAVGISKEFSELNAISSSSSLSPNNNSTSSAQDKISAEQLITAGGIGLGVGIPLWVVGTRKQHKYEHNLSVISVRLNTNQQSKGLTLSYRF